MKCPGGAECVINEFTCLARCVCNRAFYKDCNVLEPVCVPGLCHVNARCEVRNGQAWCVCKEEYRGSKLTKCDAPSSNLDTMACVSGDPHFSTYDGFRMNYHGNCPYILTQNRNEIPNFPGGFKVVAINILMAPLSKVAYINHLEVTIYGQLVKFMTNGNEIDIFFNGVKRAAPFHWPDEQTPMIRLIKERNNYVMETQHNFVIWSGPNYPCIMLPEIEPLRQPQAVMGLLGDWDGNPRNDLVCKDGSNHMGSTESTFSLSYVYSDEFIKCQDSYITTDSSFSSANCASGMVLVKKPESCDAGQFAKDCAAIQEALQGTGPFAACRSMQDVDIQTGYADCMVSMCGGSASRCKSFNSFAMQCSKTLALGVSLGAWRTVIGCPLQCGANSVYNACTSACPKNCAEMDYAWTCQERCVDTCECLPGFVVDNTETSYVKCVKQEECGCQGPQEQWHPNSKVFLNDECTLRTSCSEGKFNSRTVQCAKEAECEIEYGDKRCVCKNGFQGDGYTCSFADSPVSGVITADGRCDICKHNPCKNNGTCIADPNDELCGNYTCICENPFSGIDCVDRLECKEDSCIKGTECKIENSQIVCTCPAEEDGDPYAEGGCSPYVKTCIVQNRLNPLNHFSTQFYGTCPVLMLRNKEKVPNHVDIEIIARQHGFTDENVLTSIKEVETTIGNQSILIDRNKKIFINGKQITAPFYYPTEDIWLFSIQLTVWSTKIMIQNSYIIDFGEKRGLCVSVPKTKDFQYKHIFDGIGGNIGAAAGIACRNGSFIVPPTSDEEKIEIVQCIDSWIEPMKTKIKNDKCLTGIEIHNITRIPDCIASISKPEQCSAIKDANEGEGAFGECKVMGEEIINHFYEDCQLAVCLNENSKCTMLAAFEASCAKELKHSVENWRNSVDCPQVNCTEPNTEFKQCASQCQDTCAQKNQKTCDKGCRQGCVCKVGFIIDNTVTDRLKCVKDAECGCADQDGKWYPADSEWLSNKCKSANKCNGGILSATRNECGPNGECLEDNGNQTCICVDGFKGDGYICKPIEEKQVVEEKLTTSKPDEPVSCLITPCKNGGKCIANENDNEKHRCQCPKNYGGSICDDLDEVECNGKMCHKHAECGEKNEVPVCVCKKGYTGDGFNCTSPDNKSEEHTLKPKVLVNEGTPPPKQKEHDICASDPCKNGGVCVGDTDHPGTKFSCTCTTNFGGSICEDLLECGESTCGKNAQCTVKNNKVDCVCKTGYAGNPFKNCGKIHSACVAQDPHVKTFDGLEVDYHGTCPYLFTSSCGKSVDGHTPFQAVLKNHLSDGEGERYLSWVYEAEIELFNQTIHMDMYDEELKVNQVKQNPPFYWPNHGNPKITIVLRARTYRISTNDGLEFSFGNYKFCAHLPEDEELKKPESLCGIAGNMDGKWENDVVYKNGSVLKLDKQDYKFDFSNPDLQKCQDTWITTMKTVKREHSKCVTAVTLAQLSLNSTCDVKEPTELCHPIKESTTKSGPFAMCSIMGDHAIEGLYRDCILETCPNKTHLCQEFKVFAVACRDALPQDTDMGNWRNATGCSMECPVNSVYSTCKSACPETCAENGKTTCDKGCVEGCQCNPGYVVDNTVSNVVKCIKKADCGCTDENGNFHKASKPFLTNNCRAISQCENGSLVVKSHECGPNAACVTANSKLQCTCNFGYAGDGYECSEITKTIKTMANRVTCYPGWTYCKIMNKCYKHFNESPITFEEGKQLCARRSGEPVSIIIDEEMSFLVENFGQEVLSVWVGLTLKGTTWEWMDGTTGEIKWNPQATKTKECCQMNISPTIQDYVDSDCNSKAAGIICEALPIMSSVCDS